MSDEISNRQKRKLAREGARKLKNDVSWGTGGVATPMEKLQQLDQEARGDRVYGASEECPDCVAVRQKSGDDTALCEAHLAEAMGF